MRKNLHCREVVFIRLSAEQKAWVHAQAKRRGCKLSELWREWVEERRAAAAEELDEYPHGAEVPGDLVMRGTQP